MSDLSDRIKEAVQKSGKTQRQIAKEVGITEVSMSRYISGDRVPKASIMPVLAKALDVSTTWLYTGQMQFNSKIEMIIEYTTDGTDYQYHDNKGVLIRCKACKYWDHEYCVLDGVAHWRRKDGNDYCSMAVAI